jgi:hypothetical protein
MIKYNWHVKTIEVAILEEKKHNWSIYSRKNTTEIASMVWPGKWHKEIHRPREAVRARMYR